MALQIGELFAIISAKDSEFNKVLDNAEGAFKKTGDNLSKIGKDMTTKVTAPILGAATAALKFFGDFEESSNKVATIADKNAMSLDKMNKGALNLSNTMGIAATEINESLYQAISATGDTANALEYVEIAAKAAKGGFTNTASAIDGLTTVLNAYGLKGKEAISKVSDEMLMAQNYGKTTFGEMASAIGNVIPLTSSLNMSTTELFASIATLTKNGIGTSEAVTGMKAALSNIIKPSAEASKMAEELGLSFNASTLKSIGWAKFLDEIKKKTGGNTETMAKLFGSVEALNSVTVLATTGAEDFKGALEAVGNAAGATNSAFETMDQGMNASMSKTLNTARNLGIEFGEILAPYLNIALDKIKECINWFSSLDETQKKQIVTIGAVVAAIGPMLMIFGILFSSMGTIIGGIKGMIAFFGPLIGLITGTGSATTALSGIMGALLGPVGLVIAAVVGLIAIFVALYNTNSEFREKMLSVWNNIKEQLGIIFGQIKEIAVGVFNWLKEFWANWGWAISNSFSIAFTLIGDIFKNFLKVVSGILDIIIGLFTGNFERTIKGIGKVFEGVFMGIISGFKALINSLINGFNVLIKGMNKMSFDLPSWVPGIGGKSFGVNIPQIPYLAKGGIIDSPTLAMVGEAGKEAVVPLENTSFATTFASAVAKAVTSSMEGIMGGGIGFGGSSDGSGDIIFMIGESELGRIAISAINKLQRQAGVTLLKV